MAKAQAAQWPFDPYQDIDQDWRVAFEAWAGPTFSGIPNALDLDGDYFGWQNVYHVPAAELSWQSYRKGRRAAQEAPMLVPDSVANAAFEAWAVPLLDAVPGKPWLATKILTPLEYVGTPLSYGYEMMETELAWQGYRMGRRHQLMGG